MGCWGWRRSQAPLISALRREADMFQHTDTEHSAAMNVPTTAPVTRQDMNGLSGTTSPTSMIASVTAPRLMRGAPHTLMIPIEMLILTTMGTTSHRQSISPRLPSDPVEGYCSYCLSKCVHSIHIVDQTRICGAQLVALHLALWLRPLVVGALLFWT